MKYNLLILCFLLFSNLSFSQNEESTKQDSSSWIVLKNAAHEIGFCIFHPSQNHCTDHLGELAKREKASPDDIEVHYFEMKKEWAQNRLDKWAERQNQPVEDFLILFDISQKHSLDRSEPEKITNSYRGFVLMDLTNTIDFTFHKKNKSESIMMIKSDEKNALMENFLWREFMTGRLGRFNSEINFKLFGGNRKTGFENFKDAFSTFQKKI